MLTSLYLFLRIQDRNMPAISQRGIRMPASPIRKLVPYANAARQRGIHVYPLNIGQPDLITPPEFFTAIQNKAIQVLDYSPSEGLESYRRKLVTYYEQFATGLDYKNIIVTCGGSEAIRFAFMSCLNPGDEIIVPEPCYANYIGFANEAGVTIVAISTQVENNFDLPPAEQFEALITTRTRGILLCNPSNPTGKLYPRQELEKIRDIALKHDLYLFSDEVYKEFCYDGETFISALSLEGLEQNVIVIDSISKRYSSCGARIGNLVTRNMDVIATATKFAQARLSPPTLGQIGAEALIDLPKSYYESIKTEYVKRRDLVVSALQNMPGVICPKVSGAFYIMPALPIDDCETFCIWLLESFTHRNATLMVAPGNGFYVSPGAGKNQARIAYVLQTEDLTNAMECLALALQTYPGRTV